MLRNMIICQIQNIETSGRECRGSCWIPAEFSLNEILRIVGFGEYCLEIAKNKITFSKKRLYMPCEVVKPLFLNCGVDAMAKADWVITKHDVADGNYR